MGKTFETYLSKDWMELRASGVRDIGSKEDDAAHEKQAPKETLLNAKKSSAGIVVAVKFLFLVRSFLPNRLLFTFNFTAVPCLNDDPRCIDGLYLNLKEYIKLLIIDRLNESRFILGLLHSVYIS